MLKKVLLLLICITFTAKPSFAAFKNPFSKTKDARSEDLKYQYEVLKDDEKYRMEKRILNRTPSGFMTVEEYEALSGYKNKDELEFDIPQIERPSDFKYIPKPTYRITKYNDPPGSAELRLGKRLFLKRQINAQGIISPDYSMLVYPAVYYYPDSASVASDLFVIPIEGNDTTLNNILKANVAKRNPVPILSTDKAIDNFAAFRTLTPVDFSQDGTKLLVKEKIGSREDGIWKTKIYVYDFRNKVSYDLVEIRDAITYFWKEYMDINLDDKRWDIVPLGFSAHSPYIVVVQAYAYTGETPVYLGSWRVDWKGIQSKLISFNKSYVPPVSINGFKVIQDGVETYQTFEKQEKMLKQESKVLEKQKKEEDKQIVKGIKEEYKYTIKGLEQDYKDNYRDYKKLRSLSGSTEGATLEAAYQKYLEDQLKKDVEKAEKRLEKHKKELEKIDRKLDKLYDATGETSKIPLNEYAEEDNNEIEETSEIETQTSSTTGAEIQEDETTEEPLNQSETPQ